MRNQIVRGLLWREWRQHQELFSWTAAWWLIAVWIVPIGPQVFLLPFGILVAALLGSAAGGADAGEGVEEFSFSLPPTRSQRYLVRLGLAGLALLGLQATAIGAYALNAPQSLWGLLIQTGYTEPFSPFQPGFLYALSLALPAAIFGEAFSAGSLARSSGAARSAWLRGLVVGGLLLVIAFGLEKWITDGVTGLISCPLLATWALFRLAVGFLSYRNKEGLTSYTDPGRWTTMWVVVGVILALFAAMLLATARKMPAPPAPAYREDK